MGKLRVHFKRLTPYTNMANNKFGVKLYRKCLFFIYENVYSHTQKKSHKAWIYKVHKII